MGDIEIQLPHIPKPVKAGGMGIGTIFTTLAGVLTGWIVYSATMIDHDMPLPTAIDAEREPMNSLRSGILSAYVDRTHGGRPLLLIHSINAAASAYEMRPIFEHYRGQRPVYALDLPGFGYSERSDRRYTPKLYRDAILDYMAAKFGGEPADVIALSLGSEFAAMAALERPDLFRSLTLISPTGFTPENQDQGSNDLAYTLFSFPLWSQAFYDILATRSSIYYFLSKSFEGGVDAGLAEYDYLTAHRPGARFAPLYFVSGRLFTPEVRQQVYEKLGLPVLVLYDQDAYSSFDALPGVLARHPNWQAQHIMPTRGLPHFEEMRAVAAELDGFWAGL